MNATEIALAAHKRKREIANQVDALSARLKADFASLQDIYDQEILPLRQEWNNLETIYPTEGGK